VTDVAAVIDVADGIRQQQAAVTNVAGSRY